MIQNKNEKPSRNWAEERELLFNIAQHWKASINKASNELNAECEKSDPDEQKVEILRQRVEHLINKGNWEQKYLEKWSVERHAAAWKSLATKFKKPNDKNQKT